MHLILSLALAVYSTTPLIGMENNNGTSELVKFNHQSPIVSSLAMQAALFYLNKDGNYPKYTQVAKIPGYKSEILTKSGVPGFLAQMKNLYPPHIADTIKEMDQKHWHLEMCADFSDEEKSPAMPYYHRLNLSNNAQINIIGDLHGDSATVATIMKEYADEHTLKLKDDNSYFIFQGDCNDSGLFAPQAWYLLAEWAKHNPGKIFMIQGNHEAHRDGLMGNETASHYQALFNHKSLYDAKKEIMPFQDKHPRVILPYIIDKKTGTAHYCAITHAWIEHGITPELRDFMANPNHEQHLFAYVEIDRPKTIRSMPTHVQNKIKKEIDKTSEPTIRTKLAKCINGKGNLTKFDTFEKAPEFSDQSQWPMVDESSDFAVQKNQFENSFTIGKSFMQAHMNLLQYPRTFSEKLYFGLGSLLSRIGINRFKTLDFTISRICRSHQHSMLGGEDYEFPSMKKILEGGVWQIPLYLEALKKNGVVETTLCSPGSYYGLPAKNHTKIPFNACRVLTLNVTAAPASEWKGTVTMLPIYTKKDLDKFDTTKNLKNSKSDEYEFIHYHENKKTIELKPLNNLD